jgi:hypothetical protein
VNFSRLGGCLLWAVFFKMAQAALIFGPLFRSTSYVLTDDRCYDYLIIFDEKFDLKKAKLCIIFIITLVFDKNANFFGRKNVKNRRKL